MFGLLDSETEAKTRGHKEGRRERGRNIYLCTIYVIVESHQR
jgi:hypothetical protein